MAIEDSEWRDEITEIVCGASQEEINRGKLNVDILGAIWAGLHNIPVKHFPADWTQFENFAGPIRNKQMALYGDALILVWDNASRGSKNMRENAERYGLPISEMLVTIEITYEEEDDHS